MSKETDFRQMRMALGTKVKRAMPGRTSTMPKRWPRQSLGPAEKGRKALAREESPPLPPTSSDRVSLTSLFSQFALASA
jgi:hypothetical protein